MPLLNSLIQETPVILLHGFAMSSVFLRSFSEQLSYFYPVYLMDLPGFGDNAHLILPDRMEVLAEHLLKQVPNRCIWIGWSLGGLIATWIAAHYPERVMALINVATSPCFLEKSTWPGISLTQFTQWFDELTQQYAKAVIRFLHLQLAHDFRSKQLLQALMPLLNRQSVPLRETLEAGMTLLSLDIRPLLPHLQMPCLYLLGGKDRLVPIVVRQKIISSARQIQILEDAGHLLLITHQAECLARIQTFLNTSLYEYALSKKRDCAVI